MPASKVKKRSTPDMNGVKVQVREVDPETAESWLGKNIHNRRISQIQVGKIAGAIERGEFQFNGEPIQFDSEGRLLNGQHRLAAVIEAQKPITAVVISGLPPETQETMDTGTRRTLTHALELRGEGSAVHLAAVIRHVWRYDTNGLNDRSTFPTNQQGLAFFDENPGIRDALTLGYRIGRRIPFMSLGQVSALYYVFSRIDAEDADYFFARLDDHDGLGAGNPIYVLRKWLERQAVSARKVPPTYTFAVTIKAWNAYRKGEQISMLTFRPGGKNPEQMPAAE